MMRRRDKRAKRPDWQAHLRWLQPGLHVKRWLLLLALGVGLLSLGGSSLLREFYPVPPYFYYLTLQFVARPLRAILFLALGLGSLTAGLWGLNQALLKPFVQGSGRPVSEVLYDYHRRSHGPRIVALGGGHGQAMLLRGLKAHTANLTAIVTVADDGGSSGRLRRELGILPPGDLRNCIAALASDESLMTRLFQYRFIDGAGLEGHNFGNLFISAMVSVTGSFEEALQESSRVLAIQGQVLPSTLQAVTLVADVQQANGQLTRVRGESAIPRASGRVLNVMLEPEKPPAYPAAVKAILGADLIVIGPGSLYTSLLPNLLVPEIAEALRATSAPKLYVCNLTTQKGETENYTAEHHIQALEHHLGMALLSGAIINTELPPTAHATVQWVQPEVTTRPDWHILYGELLDAQDPWHHDSAKLAALIMKFLQTV